MNRTAQLLLVAVLGAVVLKGLIGAFESRLVFFPYPGEDETPAALGIRYATVRLATDDGETIVAWQLEPEQPIADVVYFHGNGGNLSVWLPVLAAMHRAGLRVLAIDYRGYGLSTGSPTEQGVYRDAEAAVRYVAAQRRSDASTATGDKRSERPLVYWGRSLGGPIAAHAAQVVPPDGLILESTFADKAAVIRRQPVLRALNVLSSYRFDTVRPLRDFTPPILVIHGDRDSVVRYELGQELAERLPTGTRFVTVPGLDHNDLAASDNQSYWPPILEFVRSLR